MNTLTARISRAWLLLRLIMATMPWSTFEQAEAAGERYREAMHQ